jgi:hypothetical protein
MGDLSMLAQNPARTFSAADLCACTRRPVFGFVELYQIANAPQMTAGCVESSGRVGKS